MSFPQGLLDAFETAQHSIFRLEGLQHYAGDPNFDRYRDGEPWQQTESKTHWMNLVARRRADGVAMQRVRMVEEPWTPFTAFELTQSYLFNVTAGEDIRVLSFGKGEDPKPVPKAWDFWLFDDAALWWMTYNSYGDLTSVARVTHRGWLVETRRIRREALERATPLNVYLAAHGATVTA